MPSKPIEYGEYKELLDVIKQNNVEDSYQALMGKEDKVLDTVNEVIKYHRDEDTKSREFTQQDITTIYVRLFDVWKEIIDDLTVPGGSKKSMLDIISENDRPIYIGISLIILGLFIFFIESSNW